MNEVKIVDVKYEEWLRDSDMHLAHLFIIDEVEVWLPKSQVEVDEGSKTITMPLWLVEKNDLEDAVV